jgi:uncharacterized membrane protein
MQLENFITSSTGLFHFVASIIALVLGSIILFLPKGTKLHKVLGKLYAIVMLFVLITAFMIYRLFGSWGIFHWAAIVSSLTIICGLLPVLFHKPVNSYISLHFSFMYWSVMGVYGAFISEILVRLPNVIIESGIPNAVFYYMTGIGTALIMGIASYCFIKLKPKWDKQFKLNRNSN